MIEFEAQRQHSGDIVVAQLLLKYYAANEDYGANQGTDSDFNFTAHFEMDVDKL